jgi:hypothetical protein
MPDDGDPYLWMTRMLFNAAPLSSVNEDQPNFQDAVTIC